MSSNAAELARGTEDRLPAEPAAGRAGRLAEARGPYAEPGVAPSVAFHGWRAHALALDVVARCHPGLVPHRVSGHTATTVPSELLDYMALGLAVVASNAPPVARDVAETGAALCFEAGVPRRMADRLDTQADPWPGDRMGRRGREAVERRSDREVQRVRLPRAVRRVAAGRERPRLRPGGAD